MSYSTATVATVTPPGSNDRGDTANGKQRGWTTEQNIALLEEVGNCGAFLHLGGRVSAGRML
jgi:hypothetical protein